MFQHEELWNIVEGIYPTIGIDVKLDTKAKAKIILLVDKMKYVHIEDANTSHEVWNKLKAAFEDSGLTRRLRLLRQLITTSYSTSDSIDYVSRTVSTVRKLKEVDMPVSDVWIAMDIAIYKILRNQ